MSRKIIFGEVELPLNDSMSLAQAREWVAEVYPGIEDAEGTVSENGDYVFVKKVGEKG